MSSSPFPLSQRAYATAEPGHCSVSAVTSNIDFSRSTSPNTSSSNNNACNENQPNNVPNTIQTLAVVSHKAALFHNGIASTYYQQSQYSLAIKHCRRGIELLVEKEQCRACENESECLQKFIDMHQHLCHLETKHGGILQLLSPPNRPHSRTSAAKNPQKRCPPRRREPIILTQESDLRMLRNDGTLSESTISHVLHPIQSSEVTMTCDAHLSLISAILMHNLSLCQSAIGNYDASISLLQMARTTAKMCMHDITSFDQHMLQPLAKPSLIGKSPHDLALFYMMAVSVDELLVQFEEQLTSELEASIANQNIMDLAGANGAAPAG